MKADVYENMSEGRKKIEKRNSIKRKKEKNSKRNNQREKK